MKCLVFITLLVLSSCSGAISADLKTLRAEPAGVVQVEVVNDSLDEASWSPCDQAWFIETTGGRERDPTRVYCNLGTSLPLGATKLDLVVPELAGRFSLVLTVVHRMKFVELEVGPIEVE